MGHCIYFAYVEAYAPAAAAQRMGDEEELASLADIVARLSPDARVAGQLALEDARARRPERAKIHFCRMHVAPVCRHEGARAAI